MTVRLVRYLIVIAMAVAVAACAGTPVYNVTQTPHNARDGATLEQVTEAIQQAGAGRGWQMVEDTPGHIVGTLYIRSHKAVVDVVYDVKTFSITYKDSDNLDYDGAVIHRFYNGWIENLKRDILVQTATI